jgi:ABC-type multidrug transport system ATPase subunit
MKKCLTCGRTNPADHKFCQQCGRILDNGTSPPPDAGRGDETIMTGTPAARPALRAEPRRSRSIDEVFASGKARLIIGRSPDCDILLSHPTISRRHAQLERLSDGRLMLTDLDSSNGVFVEGQRLGEACVINERERVGIGPFLFSLEKGVIHSFDSSLSLRLEARHVEKVVRGDGGKKLKLLDNINLAVEPGEFVSLLGPSGSGKSTLMDCLNGRRRATGGRVLANHEDFYRHFDNFRQSLGYVPQKDIVHAQLTVEGALTYTARLRLPTDTSPGELKHRVEEVLHDMELENRRRNPVHTLSGGQIKRLCLGAELLARPCLLFIDEATSGLDAGTDAKMMHLFRRLAGEGKSVVCITHNVENVDACHLILVLTRGKLVYYGPPGESLDYFGVDRVSEIYDRLTEKEPADWEKAFADSKLHEEYVAKRLAVEPPREQPPAETVLTPLTPPAHELATVLSKRMPAGPLSHSSIIVAPQAAVPRPRRPPVWHQFCVLTARYAELMWRDRRSLQLLFWQAPAVGLLLLVGFIGLAFTDRIPATRKLEPEEREVLDAFQEQLSKLDPEAEIPEETRAQLEKLAIPSKGGKKVTGSDMLQVLQNFHKKEVLQRMINAKVPIVPYDEIINPKNSYMLLSIVVIAVFWLGCNNAAKEIVKEEAIYARERAVNLGILPYLGSKFLVLSLVSAVQVLLLMLVIYGALQAANPTQYPAIPAEYGLGYLPQYGVLVLLSMTGVAVGLLLSACVATTDRASVLLPYVLIPQIILCGSMIHVESGVPYWLAVTLSPVYWAFRAVQRGATALPEGFPARRHFDDFVGDSVGGACLALVLQMVVALLLTVWSLRRKDIATELPDWLHIVGRRALALLPWRKQAAEA